MNYLQKRQANRSLKDSFFPSYSEGCVKITSGESHIHAKAKAEVCHWLKVQGYDFYTETKIGSIRPDIIAIKGHIGYIIEILCSESEKRFAAKLEGAYGEFYVIKVDAHTFDYDTFKL